MRRWAVVSVLLFSMIAASVGAIAEGAAGKSLSPGETDRQPPDTIAIEAHGESVIYGGDIPTARDEAITRAKVHALEKAIGTRIEDRFITQDSLLLHSYVKLETGGVVRAFRVVRESGDGANYVVDIEAWIVKGKDAQNAKLGDLMSNTSIIVAIPETTLGEPASTRYIQESLEEAMTHERFHLLDANQAAAIRAKEAELHRIDGDPQAARRIGLKYLSNIIVKGDVACRPRQINGKIHSGGTDATVKAVVADTAHMPFSISRRQEKGYGLNYEEACEQSREKAAEKVAAEVIENLRDYLNASKREIVVAASNVADGSQYRRLLNFIQTFPWVEDITNASYNEGSRSATFRVPYKERTVYLANRLDRSNDYHLVSFSDNSITIKVK